MIRIKKDRCGYSGYSCVPLPQLQDNMFDGDNQIVSALETEYNKLPIRIKGMVYSEDTINMGWPDGTPHPDVPELSCRKDTDPWSESSDVSVWGETGIPVNVNGTTYYYPVYGVDSGWTDLYNAQQEQQVGTRYFYRNTIVGVNDAVASDVYILADGQQWNNIYDVLGHVPAFTENITDDVESSIEMGPGLLEPMLDTDFDPIGIDTIPAWEAGLDASVFANIVLNSWKGVVDDRFRNIYWRLNNLPMDDVDENLLDLIDKDNSENECPTFQITLTGGTALQSVGSFTENTYEVAYGTLPINGVDIHLLPLSGLTFHFEEDDTIIYIWLTVDEDEEPISGEPYTAAVVADSEEPEADHVYLIGGVAKIVGGTDNDSYVLFKIFQENCITEVVFDRGEPSNGLLGVIKSGEEDGEVIVELPGSTDTPAPGILQPAVNIWLNDPRSQSTTDVTTVEAVYNFVHEIAAYGGPVADPKATTKEVTKVEGTTAYSSVEENSVITVSKDRANQNTQETLYALQTATTQLSAAQETYDAAKRTYDEKKGIYDDAKAAWDAEGNPESGPTYEAYQAALTQLNTAGTALDTAESDLETKQLAYDNAYGDVYGAVTKGVPGTVFTINNIVISDGSVLGGSAAVPTSYGVWTFVHGIYALSTPGTVDDTVTPHEASSGTPGTVYTVDTLDISAYTSGTYYADQVPTVKAVLDYVKSETSHAVNGYITTSADTPYEILNSFPKLDEHGVPETDIDGNTIYVTAIPGLVQPVRNIQVNDEDKRPQSTQDVPTVDAVYNFIHGHTVTESGIELPMASALATGSTMTVTAPTYDQQDSSIMVSGGSVVLGSTADPGTYFVATEIATTLDADGALITAPDCVPEAQAVVNWTTAFIAGYTATGGTISIGNDDSEGWIDGSTVFTGIVAVSDNVAVSTVEGKRSLSRYVVPTVEAVWLYVEGRTITHPPAVRGMITVENDSEVVISVPSYTHHHAGTRPSYDEGDVLPTGGTVGHIWSEQDGDETIWHWDVIYHNGTPPAKGTVQPVMNIWSGGSDHTESLNDVPTVQAVMDYIHHVTAEGYEIADARATGGTMSNVDLTVTGGTPGTVDVVENIETILVGGQTTTAPGYIPTAQAVVEYVLKNKYAPTSSVSGTLTMSVTGTTTVIVDGEEVEVDTYGEGWTETIPVTPVRGTVEVSDVILVGEPNSRVLSRQAVPSVNAVYDFIHSTAINGESASQTGYVQALNTRGTITPAASSGTGMYSESWDGEPGTVRVAKNIWMNTYHTYSVSAVPTVEAVYKFIHGMTTSNEPMLTAMATPGTIAEDDDWGYSAGTMGVVFVASSVTYPPAYASSVSYCVPSVQAMIDYVGASLPYTHATLGYVQVPNTTSEVIGNATWGTLRIVQNIDIAPSHISINPAEYETETAAPSVAAVFRFIHARYNATTQVSTALASGATITGTTTGSDPTETGIELTGGTPGTFEVSLNIKEHPASHTSLDTCVPTANAVVEYVYGLGIGHSDSGNIEIGSVTISGVVYSYGERWGQNGDKAQRGTVEVSDRILVATDSNLRVLSHEAVPSVWAVWDFVHSTHTASDDPNGGTRQALAYPDAISIGTADAEVFAGTPGTVYLANNLKVSSDSGKRLDSAKAVPTVKSVYEFVHGGAETATMSSPLATPTAMTASTTQPTLTAVPGTMYVADSIEVDSTGSITAPNCVPTAQAVVTYVAAHGGTGSAPSAVHGALAIGGTDNQEYVVNDGATPHVQGIVNVLNTVKYAKTAAKRAVTPDAVPSIISVYNFIHSTDLDEDNAYFYVQALATGATISTTGVNATCASTPGTVRVANDIKVKSGTTTVLNADVVVPTVQAVVTWVAEHGGSSPIATVNNFSTAGLVYVADYLPVTGSHPSVTVPTVDAVWSAVSGSSSSGMRWPIYSSLTNDSGGLSSGITYYVSVGGWLRVTITDSSCCCVTIDEVYAFGLGMGKGAGSPMTWLIPIGPGHKFHVGSGSVIKFDGSCSEVTRSISNSVSTNTRGMQKLSGITKYDPNDPSTAEDPDTGDELMARYTEESTTGSTEDLAIIRAFADEAEASKNNVIRQYETIKNHTTSFVTNSNRSKLCAEHTEELCASAAELYESAMSEKDQAVAQAYLDEADQCAAKANTWLARSLSYTEAIQTLHEEDEEADYIDEATRSVENAAECKERVIQENEDLVVLDITGGSFSISIATRASEEAVEWLAKVEEELTNNGIVYDRAYAIASEAYDNASSCYADLMKQASSARTYVNNLGKPQQR